MFRRSYNLPTTLEGYDKLVALVVKKYKIKDAHHAGAMISVAIRHLPPTQARCTLDYLAQYVLKSVANHVADHKSKMLQHEAQIDQMVSLLEVDPGETQAMDALQKAANDGSEYAKKALFKLGIEPAQAIPSIVDVDNVLQMKQGPLTDPVIAG